MIKFISKSELDSQKTDNQETHYVGTIYPQIFSNDEVEEFSEGMLMETGIIWLGGYWLDSNLFPKEKCPVCGKEDVLIPYKTVGSVLSGCHTIKFWCKNCHERFVTNEHIEYFRLIYRYVLNHRHEFKKKQEIFGCTKAPEGAKFM